MLQHQDRIISFFFLTPFSNALQKPLPLSSFCLFDNQLSFRVSELPQPFAVSNLHISAKDSTPKSLWKQNLDWHHCANWKQDRHCSGCMAIFLTGTSLTSIQLLDIFCWPANIFRWSTGIFCWLADIYVELLDIFLNLADNFTDTADCFSWSADILSDTLDIFFHLKQIDVIVDRKLCPNITNFTQLSQDNSSQDTSHGPCITTWTIKYFLAKKERGSTIPKY